LTTQGWLPLMPRAGATGKAGVTMAERRMPEMAVPGPQTAVVTLPAEVDLTNIVLVASGLAAALASGPDVVVADGTGTTFCDSAAVAALIRTHHQAATAAVQLRMVVTARAVRRVLQLNGADQILRVYPSLASALADGSGSSPPPAAA
jgi:anti-sigma B factor antagonist